MRLIVLLLAVAALAIAPTAAFAQSNGYTPVPDIQSSPPSSGVSPSSNVNASLTSQESGSSLASTGADLGIVALLGVVLIGGGIAIQRINRSKRDHGNAG
ncbi:MAG: hypothetical protein LT070_01775 [Solirubrobacteraceae bacterium]|nr:hypothetical protein [Solirubrobacteraceae bacterium]